MHEMGHKILKLVSQQFLMHAQKPQVVLFTSLCSVSDLIMYLCPFLYKVHIAVALISCNSETIRFLLTEGHVFGTSWLAII